MIKIPVNKNAQKEVYEMLEYLSSIEGKGILTGQHTQTRAQEELQVIFKETGKYPAICGFELLSYSPYFIIAIFWCKFIVSLVPSVFLLLETQYP